MEEFNSWDPIYSSKWFHKINTIGTIGLPAEKVDWYAENAGIEVLALAVNFYPSITKVMKWNHLKMGALF